MAITDKTRKLLWGRSGNRCIFCRKELVIGETSQDDASIIGEECHILSGQINGPRHDASFPKEQIDSYENLLLLCRVHHKMIDDQFETYTADILRQLKINHEKWVTESLNETDNQRKIKIVRIKENIPEYLRRLTTGKQVLSIVENAYELIFDHDEPNSDLEACLIGDFLQMLKDWGDMGADLEPAHHVRFGYELTQQLAEIEENGYSVFGAREIRRIEGGKRGPEAWPVAIVQVLRQDNENIVKVDMDAENQENSK